MIDRAYLAGLIDGEGCISIFRHKNDGCRDDHYSYRPLVQVAMVYKPLIKMLQAQYGGKYKETKPRDGVRRGYATWTLRGGNCIELLRNLEPLLIAKREEARHVIAFWDDKSVRLAGGAMKGIHGVEREALKAKREWYRLHLQALKKYEFGSSWDAGEVGGSPERVIPSQAETQVSGVCNEHEPAPKGEMCSELGRNVESAAETIAPRRLRSVG